MTAAPSFESALAEIRSGASYSLCGMSLTVNGIAMAITDDEFERAWDAMEEIDGPEDALISLADAPPPLHHPARASRTAMTS